MAEPRRADYLTRLAARALGMAPLAQARILPRFADESERLHLEGEEWAGGEVEILVLDTPPPKPSDPRRASAPRRAATEAKPVAASGKGEERPAEGRSWLERLGLRRGEVAAKEPSATGELAGEGAQAEGADAPGEEAAAESSPSGDEAEPPPSSSAPAGQIPPSATGDPATRSAESPTSEAWRSEATDTEPPSLPVEETAKETGDLGRPSPASPEPTDVPGRSSPEPSETLSSSGPLSPAQPSAEAKSVVGERVGVRGPAPREIESARRELESLPSAERVAPSAELPRSTSEPAAPSRATRSAVSPPVSRTVEDTDASRRPRTAGLESARREPGVFSNAQQADELSPTVGPPKAESANEAARDVRGRPSSPASPSAAEEERTRSSTPQPVRASEVERPRSAAEAVSESTSSVPEGTIPSSESTVSALDSTDTVPESTAPVQESKVFVPESTIESSSFAETSRLGEPLPTDEASADALSGDAPSVEAQSVEAPSVEAPSVETSSVEASSVDVPIVEAPVEEARGVEASPPSEASARADAVPARGEVIEEPFEEASESSEVRPAPPREPRFAEGPMDREPPSAAEPPPAVTEAFAAQDEVFAPEARRESAVERVETPGESVGFEVPGRRELVASDAPVLAAQGRETAAAQASPWSGAPAARKSAPAVGGAVSAVAGSVVQRAPAAVGSSGTGAVGVGAPGPAGEAAVSVVPIVTSLSRQVASPKRSAEPASIFGGPAEGRPVAAETAQARWDREPPPRLEVSLRRISPPDVVRGRQEPSAARDFAAEPALPADVGMPAEVATADAEATFLSSREEAALAALEAADRAVLGRAGPLPRRSRDARSAGLDTSWVVFPEAVPEPLVGERRGEDRSESPAFRVSIGRLEITTPPPEPPAVPAAPEGPSATADLETYLEKRRAGRYS